MKYILIILILIFKSNTVLSQIEIDDKSSEPEVKTTFFNGEFMSFNGIYDKSKKASVQGNLVTLIDVSTYNIYKDEIELKKRNSVSFKLDDLFSNKTFEIENYFYDLGDILKIKNESGTFFWKVGGTDKYVFNKYIDNIKQKFEGKSFIPIFFESEFETMDGDKINIDGNKTYTVNKVSFAKLRFDYGIIFKINDSFECIFPNGTFDQPRIFNGEKYAIDDNYINIESNEIFKSKVLLIEQNEFQLFSKVNSLYLSKIRNREVQLGMTEKQCRFSWGSPTTSYENIAGYDLVHQYGDIGNSQNLYFKNGKLELIK